MHMCLFVPFSCSDLSFCSSRDFTAMARFLLVTGKRIIGGAEAKVKKERLDIERIASAKVKKEREGGVQLKSGKGKGGVGQQQLKVKTKAKAKVQSAPKLRSDTITPTKGKRKPRKLTEM